MDKLSSVSKSVDGGTITNSYGYNNDRLFTITHNGFNYNFSYDSLGNNTSISVGNQNLITNSYDLKTGRLTSSTYSNGQTVSQSYDNSDRVTKKQNNGNDIAAYEYDASGNLGYKNDLVNNVSYRYIYDLSNRLTKTTDSLGNITNYILDPNGNGNSIAELINGKVFQQVTVIIKIVSLKISLTLEICKIV